MRDFSEVHKQIERMMEITGQHPTYEIQQAVCVNAISLSSFLLGVLEGEDMVKDMVWGRRKANERNQL